MSRVSRGISLVFYFLLYLMNFSLERSSSSRFGFRVVRRTKVQKLQSVDDSVFYGIVSSEAELRDNGIYGAKSRRGANYEVDGQKRGRGRKLFSRRKKVAPEVHVREEAWTEKSENKIAMYRDSEGSCSYREEGGKVTMGRSERWNTKTGKQIRTEEKQTQPSSSYSFMDMFLNDLTPPSVDNFQTCLSNGLPCDPFFVELKVDDVNDVPSTSGGISHVTLNLRKGEAWAEEVKLTDKKSKLTKFLSRFKRAKTTKVKKIRL